MHNRKSVKWIAMIAIALIFGLAPSCTGDDGTNPAEKGGEEGGTTSQPAEKK